jgi:hypothetical protein
VVCISIQDITGLGLAKFTVLHVYTLEFIGVKITIINELHMGWMKKRRK